MKKTNLILLSTLLSVGIAGCSGGGGSDPAPAPKPVNQTATGAPTISGTATVGQTLTAGTTAIADANGLPSTFTYQWKADGQAIAGATNASYVLTENEKGKAISVTVSFTDNDGFAETVTSNVTSQVAALNQTATGAPTISGTATVGQTLTAGTSGISDANGLPSTFTYQWKADGQAIAGATNASYV